MTRRTEADEAWERAEQFARDVIAERARLDRDDPDWDLLLENAREAWIGPPAGPVPDDVAAVYQRRAAMTKRLIHDVQL